MMHGIRTAAALLLAGVVAASCIEATAGPTTLTNAHVSPESLARAALDALAADDRKALSALRVDREEYERLLWPELPESGDMPFALAWQMNDANSRKGVNNLLADLGGTRFELVRIRFTGTPERYEGFTVHSGAEMVVRRRSDGREGRLELLDVMVERAGRWKAMNFDEG